MCVCVFLHLCVRQHPVNAPPCLCTRASDFYLLDCGITGLSLATGTAVTWVSSSTSSQSGHQNACSEDTPPQHFRESVCVCEGERIWCVRVCACGPVRMWIIDEDAASECPAGAVLWVCEVERVRVCICLSVEMGDKSAVHQQKQPPYDGLCNYAQKITSCFGLDGKHRLRLPSVLFYVIYGFISIGGWGALCLRLICVHCFSL